MIKPEILTTKSKILVGLNRTMCLSDNRTAELWREFMPLLPGVSSRCSEDRISLQVYSPDYFSGFNPDHTFVKWALVEVADIKTIPECFETFTLPEGTYAVFKYKGLSSDNSIFQYIFAKWLPESGFVLSNRPHFEVLGAKYKNNDPESEEEIWIPVE